jgi:hypothetical protein
MNQDDLAGESDNLGGQFCEFSNRGIPAHSKVD